MGRAALDEKTLQGMSPGQRKQLKKSLEAADRKPGKNSPPRKKKSGPGLLFFLVYGVACAAGGVYFDRHLLPQTRIWLGEKVQTIGGFGQEQEILGHLEQSGISDAEKAAAMADVRKVYAAKREGTLSESQLEDLARAERPFATATTASRAVDPDDMKDALETFASLAGR